MSINSDQEVPCYRLGLRLGQVLHRGVDWMVLGPKRHPPDIEHQLLLQSMPKARALTALIIVATLTASVAAAMTGESWAYAWVLASICIGCIRLWAVHCFAKAETSGRSGNLIGPILAGLLYYAVTGAGCYQCVTSGEWPLISMAGFGLAALIGAISSHNAGTPRLALIHVFLLMVPFSLGCLISPVPHLFILGIQLPLFACAVTFGMFQNYTVLLDLRHSERENRQLAEHDMLTGLPNRALNLKCFEQLLANLNSAPGAPHAEFMVFCLDLDGFKQVNDSFGHAAGDAVLVAVAQRLRDTVRSLDFLSRIGGDEFVILLPVISVAAAARIAESIISSVSAPFDIGLPAPVHIAVSIGGARAPDDGESADELLRSADRALYEAKSRGKGIFVAHDTLAVSLVPAAGTDAGMARLDRREKRTDRSPLPFRSESV